MVILSILELFQSLSLYDPEPKIDEAEDFLKFGKLVFSTVGRINYVDTDYLLKELKLDGIDARLLPSMEFIKGFYSVEEILTVCKKNSLQHLLNMCIKVSLDYIVMVLKGSYYHNLKCLSSFAKDIVQYAQVSDSESTYFCNDSSVYIVDFLESLFNLLDANYVKELSRVKVKINIFIKCTIVGCMKDYAVRQRIILRTIMKMQRFAVNVEAHMDHLEDFLAIEQMGNYLLLSKEALKHCIKLQSKLLKPPSGLWNREDIEVFLESLTKMTHSPCILLRHLASTCLKQVKTYEDLL